MIVGYFGEMEVQLLQYCFYGFVQLLCVLQCVWVVECQVLVVVQVEGFQWFVVKYFYQVVGSGGDFVCFVCVLWVVVQQVGVVFDEGVVVVGGLYDGFGIFVQ